MKNQASGFKKKLIITGIIIIVMALLVFVGYPLWQTQISKNPANDVNDPQIAKDVDGIDFDSESGRLYINNEIILMTQVGVSQKSVESLVEPYHAKIVTAMQDIGFWQIRFDNAMTYEEIEEVISSLNKNRIVEKAYYNSIYEMESDAVVKEIPNMDPVFPDDPWRRDGRNWDTDVPRGLNWGAEAIEAPGAWGYLEYMTKVNVGLIDSMVDINHEDITTEETFITVIGEEVKTYSADKVTAQKHGTHVAGTIAADFDNETGVSGIVGDKGNLYYSAAYTEVDGEIVSGYYTAVNYLEAIRALVNSDVKVINISQNTNRLIGFAASMGNEAAIDHLQDAADIAGIGLQRMIKNGNEFVLCMAAGNSNSTDYYEDDKQTYGYRTFKINAWEKGKSGGSEAKYNNFLNLIDIKEVKERIIVVGSVKIDEKNSSAKETNYSYSAFSNIGERVDVVAPGEQIYSCVVGGYEELSGTSMAAPHASGVAGLIFACNSDLTGAEVKQILLASTTGRYYYEDGSSGLVNARIAVEKALKTQDNSVNQVIETELNEGLDLCFVVDTTMSMSDDIDNAKANMTKVLDELTKKNDNFRVAIVDYRDFPDRAEYFDYPSLVQLDFSQDKEKIINAINGLSLGNGGDIEETVYSGLIEAANLDWRANAKKTIIVLGDAAPLDPEPYTGYTYRTVLSVLYSADISMASDSTSFSGELKPGDGEDSMINMYAIGTSAVSDMAEDFFAAMAEDTGGSYTNVESAEYVSEAIISTIEQIEILSTQTVELDFGEDYSNERVRLYNNDKYMFEFLLDDSGSAVLDAMVPGNYDWSFSKLAGTGSFRIKESKNTASVSFNNSPWYAFAVKIWHRQRGIFAVLGLILIVVVAASAVMIKKGKKQRKNKAKKIENRFCTTCGTPIDSSFEFCNQCGTRLKKGSRR